MLTMLVKIKKKHNMRAKMNFLQRRLTNSQFPTHSFTVPLMTAVPETGPPRWSRITPVGVQFGRPVAIDLTPHEPFRPAHNPTTSRAIKSTTDPNPTHTEPYGSHFLLLRRLRSDIAGPPHFALPCLESRAEQSRGRKITRKGRLGRATHDRTGPSPVLLLLPRRTAAHCLLLPMPTSLSLLPCFHPTRRWPKATPQIPRGDLENSQTSPGHRSCSASFFLFHSIRFDSFAKNN